MDYCTNCGCQIDTNIDICPNCGYRTKVTQQNFNANANANTNTDPSGIRTAAKILMIIATIASGFSLIPLLWTIPMTVSYCNSIKENRQVGVGFKICTLLFVNTIAGILMLCDE